VKQQVDENCELTIGYSWYRQFSKHYGPLSVSNHRLQLFGVCYRRPFS